MIYIFTIFMIFVGYYSFTYGISLWRDDKNRLASFGVIAISIIGTVLPLVVMFMKR